MSFNSYAKLRRAQRLARIDAYLRQWVGVDIGMLARDLKVTEPELRARAIDLGLVMG